MNQHIRFLAPAAIAAVLALAGCQTTPGDRAARGGGQVASPAGQAQPAGESGAASAATPAPMPVEFFIAQLEPQPGLAEVTLGDGSLYVQQMPVLTRGDLAEAAAMVDKQGQHFVGLRFNEEGARKLAEVSSRNVGKVMVLAVNRQLVAVPRIAEPLDRGVMAFRVDDAQAAREIASAIRGEPEAANGPFATGAASAPRQPSPARQ